MRSTRRAVAKRSVLAALLLAALILALLLGLASTTADTAPTHPDGPEPGSAAPRVDERFV